MTHAEDGGEDQLADVGSMNRLLFSSRMCQAHLDMTCDLTCELNH